MLVPGPWCRGASLGCRRMMGRATRQWSMCGAHQHTPRYKASSVDRQLVHRSGPRSDHSRRRLCRCSHRSPMLVRVHPLAYQIVYNTHAVHMLIANDEVLQYIANPDIHRSSHMYQSPFGDWARAAHRAGVTRLVQRIALISIHYLIQLAEANPGDPVSVHAFGHMSQQPTSRHHKVV